MNNHQHQLTCIIISIVIMMSLSSVITAQANIEVNNLRGQGKTLLYADEDGVIKRSNGFTNGKHYMTISPLDFQGIISPIPIKNVNSVREFFAPVHLPHGVRINKVSYWYQDNITPNLAVEMYRKSLSQSVIIFSKNVGGTPMEPTEVTIDIGAIPVAVIDNDTYYYYIRIRSVNEGQLVEWPAELTFYRLIIEYEYI